MLCVCVTRPRWALIRSLCMSVWKHCRWWEPLSTHTVGLYVWHDVNVAHSMGCCTRLLRVNDAVRRTTLCLWSFDKSEEAITNDIFLFCLLVFAFLSYCIRVYPEIRSAIDALGSWRRDTDGPNTTWYMMDLACNARVLYSTTLLKDVHLHATCRTRRLEEILHHHRRTGY